MSKPINHYGIKPEVNLTDQIQAAMFIEPSVEGRMSAHKIWIPANAEYPVHQHPSPHIIILLEGGGWMKCTQNGEETHSSLQAGDVFHMPNNTPHQVGADSRGIVMIAISIDSMPLTDPERMKII